MLLEVSPGEHPVLLDKTFALAGWILVLEMIRRLFEQTPSLNLVNKVSPLTQTFRIFMSLKLYKYPTELNFKQRFESFLSEHCLKPILKINNQKQCRIKLLSLQHFFP